MVLNYLAVCIKNYHSAVVPLSSLFFVTEGIVYYDVILFFFKKTTLRNYNIFIARETSRHHHSHYLII